MIVLGWIMLMASIGMAHGYETELLCENCASHSSNFGTIVCLSLLAFLCFSRHYYKKLEKDLNIPEQKPQSTTTSQQQPTKVVATLTDYQINKIAEKIKKELAESVVVEVTRKIDNVEPKNIESEISYGRIPTAEEKKKERNKMTDRLRTTVLERDNYTCKNCGLSKHQEPHLCLHVDHIIPIAKGGKTHERNLQTLCWECNLKKGDKIEK